MLASIIYCDLCNRRNEHKTDGRGYAYWDRETALELGWIVDERGRDVCPACQDNPPATDNQETIKPKG